MPNPPPPPPPPGPPPPPLFTPNAGGAGGDDPKARNMLLVSIRQGTKLKKTVTVDKSAPLIGNAKSSTPNNSSLHGGRSNGDPPRATNGPPMGLGGLFAGGMPVLKSTGRATGGGSVPRLPKANPVETSNNSVIGHQKSNSVDQSRSNFGQTNNQQYSPSPTNNSIQNSKIAQSNNITLNNSSLFRQNSETQNTTFPSDIKNRGPPPQPPPANRKPSMRVSTSDSVLTAHPGLSAGKKNNPPLPSKPPVGGYGKPNSAPRPPSQPPAPGNKPAPPPKSPLVQGMNGPPTLPQRPQVSRAQSMRTQRPANSPTPELGEYREQHFQSQEALHHMTNGLNYSQRPMHANTMPLNLSGGGGKALAPAPPPLSLRMAPSPPALSAKPLKAPSARPPPPPPSKFTITPPMVPPPPPPTAAPPPPITAPPPPSAAPPPPPHRTASSPSAAVAPKLSNKPNTMQPPPPGGPPPPPVRNSSMRNGSAGFGDFEHRFGSMFHSVAEFPPPIKFLNRTKVYSSRTAKQPAPQPPRQAPNVHLQLGNKMWANDTSTC